MAVVRVCCENAVGGSQKARARWKYANAEPKMQQTGWHVVPEQGRDEERVGKAVRKAELMGRMERQAAAGTQTPRTKE